MAKGKGNLNQREVISTVVGVDAVAAIVEMIEIDDRSSRYLLRVYREPPGSLFTEATKNWPRSRFITDARFDGPNGLHMVSSKTARRRSSTTGWPPSG